MLRSVRSLFELEQDHDLVLGASLAVAGGALMPTFEQADKSVTKGLGRNLTKREYKIGIPNNNTHTRGRGTIMCTYLL